MPTSHCHSPRSIIGILTAFGLFDPSKFNDKVSLTGLTFPLQVTKNCMLLIIFPLATSSLCICKEINREDMPKYIYDWLTTLFVLIDNNWRSCLYRR